MNPLTSLFGAAVAVRNGLYSRGILRAHQLKGAVISIGNISVGGTGKTPFTIMIGELLRQRGIEFDILSRGYGRKTRGTTLVDPGGTPEEYGDEPLLMARRLGVCVVVGEGRYPAGLLAERKFGPRLHLLDDGFQHRRLWRDFDIVLVTPDDARDRLLPAGRLREPLSSLRRADAVVMISGADPGQFPIRDKQLVWRVRRGIIPPRDMPKHPVAFCGIARPQNFFAQLRTAGVELAAEAVFRDHHQYTETDIRDLLRLREQSEADGFVATEKDAINLGQHLEALRPLTIVPVRMQLENASAAMDTMLATIEERRKRRA